MRNSLTLLRAALVAAALMTSTNALAASGEMGTGVPRWAQFGDVYGGYILVKSLSGASIPFPSGCESGIIITSGTMGRDPLAAAISMLLAAKITGVPVRFVAHTTRDGGCGVDYIELAY
jgi:hypothetical protein